MKIMYEARDLRFGGKITEVEIERETEQSVWINGRRSARSSEYRAYFDSYKLAKEHIIACHTAIVDSATASLENANNHLQEAMKL